MKKKKAKSYKNMDSLRSYVAWLVVPVMLVWLTFGYIMGHLKENPLWLNKSVLGEETEDVVPYFKDFEKVPFDSEYGYITLWFDDAWLSQYMTAYPMLQKYNFPGTIAVPTNAIERINYMNWAQVTTLQKNGWEVTNHSAVHNCSMDKWDKKKVVGEYETSKLSLWKHNVTSDIFVTPCGVDSNIMREESKLQFSAYRTVNPGINEVDNIDFYDLKVRNMDINVDISEAKSWIDEAVTTKNWVILVFHQVGGTNEFKEEDLFNTKTEDLENLLDYIKETQIEVVVPSQMRI